MKQAVYLSHEELVNLVISASVQEHIEKIKNMSKDDLISEYNRLYNIKDNSK